MECIWTAQVANELIDDMLQVEQALKKAQEAVSTSTASTVMPSLAAAVDMTRVVTEEEEEEDDESVGLSASELEALHRLQGALSSHVCCALVACVMPCMIGNLRKRC